MATRLYIGKLPSDVRERDVERFFRGYGKIVDILLRKGYGFVEFDYYRDAEDAIYELNGEKFLGQRIVIEPTRKAPRTKRTFRSPTRTSHRLIVENLPSRIDWRELKDLMRRAGEVVFADAHKDRKHEGVVEFASRHDMKRAVKMFDDTELNRRYIRLIEDRRNGCRSSRSGSRRQSRSSTSRSSSEESYRRSRSRSSSGSYESDRSSERSVSRSRHVPSKHRSYK